MKRNNRQTSSSNCTKNLVKLTQWHVYTFLLKEICIQRSANIKIFKEYEVHSCKIQNCPISSQRGQFRTMLETLPVYFLFPRPKKKHSSRLVSHNSGKSKSLHPLQKNSFKSQKMQGEKLESAIRIIKSSEHTTGQTENYEVLSKYNKEMLHWQSCQQYPTSLLRS